MCFSSVLSLLLLKLLYFAAALVAKDIDALFQRATELEKKTQTVIAANSHLNYSRYLLVTLKYHNTEVGKIRKQLQTLIEHNVTYRLNQINRFEESLLYNENRVSEEIELIGEIAHFFKNKTTQTAQELLDYGQKLIKLGTDYLLKYRYTDPKPKEIKFIEFQVDHITELIDDVNRTHPTGVRLDDVEIALILSERSLKALVERVQLPFNIPYLDP